MRIAILTCGILPIPAVQGGAVENLIDFYLEYNDLHRIHDITVYSIWDPKIIKESVLSSNNNHYFFIDVTSYKARITRRIRKFFHPKEYYNYFIEYYFEKAYEDLKNKNYDIILLENCPGHAYKLSRRGFHNLILHLHNDLLNDHTRYHDIIANSLMKVITVSDYIKGRVSTVFPFNKIQTVYNGIDLKSFAQENKSNISRKSLGFSKEDFLVIYSGRINKEKGVSELIESFLQLKDIPQIKLIILGSSFFDNANLEDEFIYNLRNKSIEIKERIVFTGFIPYNQIPAYLKLADIAVLPSMWEEPFGLTIVEAMASGLPLITTRSGGIPEICKDTAIVIDRENVVDNITSSILDLYYNPEKRQQMSIASLYQAKSFDKTTYAEKLFVSLEGIQ